MIVIIATIAIINSKIVIAIILSLYCPFLSVRSLHACLNVWVSCLSVRLQYFIRFFPIRNSTEKRRNLWLQVGHFTLNYCATLFCTIFLLLFFPYHLLRIFCVLLHVQLYTPMVCLRNNWDSFTDQWYCHWSLKILQIKNLVLIDSLN